MDDAGANGACAALASVAAERAHKTGSGRPEAAGRPAALAQGRAPALGAPAAPALPAAPVQAAVNAPTPFLRPQSRPARPALTGGAGTDSHADEAERRRKRRSRQGRRPAPSGDDVLRRPSVAQPERPAPVIAREGVQRDARRPQRPTAQAVAGARRGRGPSARACSYAALDLGTNNCRLLIAEPGEAGFRVVDAFSRIVRLGEGLGATGALGEGAIQRSIDALRICSSKMASRNVTRARLVATEACRAAINGADFVRRVHEETGLRLEVVDRRTEAFLAVSGCASLADPASEALLVFDIGGGSTEVACLVGRGVANMSDPCDSIADWVSLPVGVVTLAERYGGRTVTPATYAAMVDEVLALLEPFRARVGWAALREGFHLLGTSGTVTTVAGVHLRLPRYDRRRVDGLWMSDRNVNRVVQHLRRSSYRERAANGCIGNERADLVLAGCAILDALRKGFPAPRLRIADRGLREGILMSMMREDGVMGAAQR